MRDDPNEVIRMYGLTRATTTLLAAAVAGFLIWLAGQFSNNHEGGYWAIMGVLAGAGLVMALSQLLGGPADDDVRPRRGVRRGSRARSSTPRIALLPAQRIPRRAVLPGGSLVSGMKRRARVGR